MTRYKHSGKSDFDHDISLGPPRLVEQFLFENGRSRRGPIEKYLQDKSGKKYSDHKGLDYILDKVIENGKIRKLPKGPGRPYPEYELTQKGMNNIGLEANVFATDASRELLNYFIISSGTTSSLLEEIIRKIGIYTIFVYLQAWRNTLSTNSRKENVELVNTWINHVLPMRDLSTYLEQLVIHLSSSSEKNKTYIFEDENKKKILKDLQKELGKLYPDDTNLCQAVFETISSRVKEEKNKMYDRKELEKWIKLQEKRNTKFSKKNIKENECPRCHYDGTKPVPKGPSKGKTFRLGFSLVTTKNRQSRSCPVCGLWQEVKSG